MLGGTYPIRKVLAVEEHVGLHAVDRRCCTGRGRHAHDVKGVIIVILDVLLPQRWLVCMAKANLLLANEEVHRTYA